MRAIYRMHIDCGRQGEISGVFTVEKEKLDRLIESGVFVHFGEVLGKHSDIGGILTKEQFTLVSDDPDVVAVIDKHDLSSGYNPFDYVEEEAIEQALLDKAADEEEENEGE